MADHHQQYHHTHPPSPSSQPQDHHYPSFEQPYDDQYQQQYPQDQQHYSHPQVQEPAAAYAGSPSQHTSQPLPPNPKQRTFSFQSNKSQSNKSHKSTGSHTKAEGHESHAEKEARRLHGKSDPTMAISEAEPALVQAMTKSSLAPLRSIQHRDSYGNSITEPDRSNPTRNRWERPLDTVRSFEAAIDGSYSRKSVVRSDSESVANWNRRSSYFGGSKSRATKRNPRNHAEPAASDNGPRFPQDGMHGGGRPTSMIRPDSTHIDYNHPNRSSYFDSMNPHGPAHAQNGYGGGHGRQRVPRMMSEPVNEHGRGEPGVYPMPHKDRSYETVTTAAGSGSSGEQAGYQTDLTSSDNSSVERRSPGKRAEPVNDYGIGFNQPSPLQPAAFNMGHGAQGPGPSGTGPQAAKSNPSGMAPPPVPAHNGAGGGGVLRKQSSAQSRPDVGEKRKSWFTRRFSKNS